MDANVKATKADGIAEKVEQPLARVTGQSVSAKEESVSSENSSLSREPAASQSRLHDQVPVVSASNSIRDEQLPKGDFNKLQGVDMAEDDQNQAKGKSRLDEGEKDTKTGNVQPPSGAQMDKEHKGDEIKEEPLKSSDMADEEMDEEEDTSPPSSSHTTNAIVTHCTAALIGQSNVIDHINLVSSEKQMVKSSQPLPLDMGTETAVEKEILDKGGSEPKKDKVEEDSDDKDKSTEKSQKETKEGKGKGQGEAVIDDNDKSAATSQKETKEERDSGKGEIVIDTKTDLGKSSGDDKVESIQKADHGGKDEVLKAPSPSDKQLKTDENVVKEAKLDSVTSTKKDHQESAGQGKGGDIKDMSVEKEQNDKKEIQSSAKGDVVSSGDHLEKDGGDKGVEGVGKLTAEQDSSVISVKKAETKPSAKMDHISDNAKNDADLPEYVKMGLSDGNIEIQESTIQDANTIRKKSLKEDAIGGQDKDQIHKDKHVKVANVDGKAAKDVVDKEEKATEGPSESKKIHGETKNVEEKSPKVDKESVPDDLTIKSDSQDTIIPETISGKTEISDKSKNHEKEHKDGVQIEKEHRDGVQIEQQHETPEKEHKNEISEPLQEAIEERPETIAEKSIDVVEIIGDNKIVEIISEHTGKEISESKPDLTDDVSMGIGRSTSDKKDQPTETSKDVPIESMDKPATKDKKDVSEKTGDVVTKIDDAIKVDDVIQVGDNVKKQEDDVKKVEDDAKKVEDDVKKDGDGVTQVGKDVETVEDDVRKGEDDVSKLQDGVTPDEGMQIRDDAVEEKLTEEIPGKLIAAESDANIINGSLENAINKPAAMPTVPSESIDNAAKDKVNPEIKMEESVGLHVQSESGEKDKGETKDKIRKSKEKDSRKKSGARKGESDTALELGDEEDKDGNVVEESRPDEQNVVTEINDSPIVIDEDKMVVDEALVSDDMAVQDIVVANLENAEPPMEAEEVDAIENVSGDMDEKQSPEKIDTDRTELPEKQNDDSVVEEKEEEKETTMEEEKVTEKEDEGLAADIQDEISEQKDVKVAEDDEKVEEKEKKEEDEKVETSILEVEIQAEDTRGPTEVVQVRIEEEEEEEEERRAGANNKDGDHDSGVDETTQRKKTPPSAKGSNTAPSPAKKAISPTTATASPAKTQKAPNTATKAATTPAPSLPEKKLPMNKIVVGTSPSPNLKVVRSKIGSFENVKHKAGGGQIKVETKKIDLANVKSRIGSTDNIQHKPTGGEKKILSRKLEWKAQSKVGSMDNATHKPGGGNKKIEVQKLEFKDKAKPKVGSKDNIQHKPGGGELKIEEHKLSFKDSAQSKVGSMDYVKHQPGGGNIQIFDEKFYHKQQRDSSKKSSLTNSDEHISDNRTPSPSAAMPHLQQPGAPDPAVNSPSTPVKVQDVGHTTTNGDSPLPAGVELAGKH